MDRLAGTRVPAEGEGFEPPVGFPTTVFKTAALNRSANPPDGRDHIPPRAQGSFPCLRKGLKLAARSNSLMLVFNPPLGEIPLCNPTFVS
jgi:hypothetical protein